MQPIRILSVAEQTAENLRTGLREGRWSGTFPPRHRDRSAARPRLP